MTSNATAPSDITPSNFIVPAIDGRRLTPRVDIIPSCPEKPMSGFRTLPAYITPHCYALIITIVAFASGCASNYTPPTQLAPIPATTTAVSADEAWRRTLDFLASSGITLTSSDRAGGVIAAKPAMTRERMLTWVDCGTSNGKSVMGLYASNGVVTTADLSVTIQPAASGATVRPALTIVATWDRPIYGGTMPINCASTGTLERELLAAISR